MDIMTGVIVIVALICGTVIACNALRANTETNRPPEVRVVQIERMQVSPSPWRAGFMVSAPLPTTVPAPLPNTEAIRERADAMAYLIEAHGMSGDQAWQYLRSWAYAHNRMDLIQS